MTYLLTQILLCLALAMIAGAAIGWLISGHRAGKREHKIREELIRQSLALNQAETDNKMIEDDYRELKFRSEETVALLKQENKQIPVLNQNLDKSQTLVRQMLQKHEAEQRQLATENNLLATKLKELENRERAVAKLQMELNTERLNRKMGLSAAATPASGTAAASTPEAETEAATQVSAEADTQVNTQADTHSNSNEATSSTTTTPESEKPAIAPSLLAAARTVDESSAVTQTEMSLDTPDAKSDLTQESLTSQTIAQAISELEAVNEDAKPGELTEIETTHTSTADEDTALSDSEPVVSVDDNEETLTKTYDFGQSDHEDNLQEIFGIGPVAERTLRKLGITSFEQLASLEREHIEYIANVLEIFPGRIERDDWVGSARKRVEQAKSAHAHDTANDTTHESDLPELEDA